MRRWPDDVGVDRGLDGRGRRLASLDGRDVGHDLALIDYAWR
jgi:hypothetical protein